jgi:hypothetical protein
MDADHPAPEILVQDLGIGVVAADIGKDQPIRLERAIDVHKLARELVPVVSLCHLASLQHAKQGRMTGLRPPTMAVE